MSEVKKQELPAKMKAVMAKSVVTNVEDFKNSLAVEEVDLPVLQPGQVLVKVYYSTVNPSDVLFVQNRYGTPLNPPCTPGFEGCGVVVASAVGMIKGVLAQIRLGKKVTFFAPLGVWAEYIALDASQIVALPDDTPLEKAANAMVNPMTVLAFLDLIKANNQTSLIHTAAASGLGRMLIRSCKNDKVDIICVVRRQEQEEICRKEGAQYIVNTSEADWQSKLKKMAADLGTKTAFDAVGGQLPNDVLAAMPNGSTCHVYGLLDSDAACKANVHDLIFRNQTLKGFWLSEYLKTKTTITMVMWTRKITQMLTEDFATNITKTVGLAEIAEGIEYYLPNMSAGKILIKVAEDPSSLPPLAPEVTEETAVEKETA